MGSPFWRVWFGESVSGLGDAAFAVAFWVVLSTTGLSTVLAATLVAGAVPRGVLLLLGGAVVDRVSALTALLAAHLVRGFSVGGLAMAVVAGDPGLTAFIAAAVAVGAADAFAGPAGLALLPVLVPADRLPRATRSYRQASRSGAGGRSMAARRPRRTRPRRPTSAGGLVPRQTTLARLIVSAQRMTFRSLGSVMWRFCQAM